MCIIPVRGGSKGLPGKNARNLGGKPLLAWTIEQARSSVASLDIIVSTDDDDLASIALTFGAEVPYKRPEYLAQDETQTEPVVLHALQYQVSIGKRPDAILLLQATSPVRLEGTIDRAISQFTDSGVDSLVGVVPQTPFLWQNPTNPKSAYDFTQRPRRQELKQNDMYYRETGSLYLTKTEIYESHENRLGGKVGLFIMNEIEGTDIDSLADFALAEQIVGSLQSLEVPSDRGDA